MASDRVLTDIHEISQLGVRYAAAIDSRDFSALAACFTNDGVWAGPAGERCGRAVIASYGQGAVGHLDVTQHIATNFRVVVDGDGALMQSYFHAIHVLGPETFTIGGHYEDRVVRQDGVWLIARRDITPAWSSGNANILRRPQIAVAGPEGTA